ncbi:nickel ABC transporter permease [Hyphomicrobium nitrativorans NL23]|uniref:Nickel/cobalt efflux system n=1 Tax=Hyphomicrobium nitrativorans NL23 TaxID=1029756 RepID=V5SDZ2_9HYPH|nr:nickel/cobalt transporter [Hyphomicrobium nitrativorans]AHB48270.1 nickel ABC transporter permease [Hyphomicrobium nitrativorans NL23]
MRIQSLIGALFVCLAVSWSALAQSDTRPSPFGIPVPGQAQGQSPQTAERSVLRDAWSWLLMQQQRLNREMAAAVRQMKSGSVLDATLLLAFIGFSYGVLHAAGPGHGKAVISSYVLANHETVRRGILLSFLAAFIQALSAIAIVGLLAVALNATRVEINAAEGWIETISWAFVALIGAWLLYSQIAALVRRRSERQAVASTAHTHTHGASCCGHDHDHEHDHRHDHGHRHAHDHEHTHKSQDAHAACETCGHAHIPDPTQLRGPMSWSKALAIAFSVGIRPCTGAILILVFALSQGLLLAGVFATFAMAFGTAITVSVLAALAVGSRELAKRMAGGDGRLAGFVTSGIGIGGAALVFVLGASFFVGSLGPGGPL